MKNLCYPTLALALCITLAGCGGGGGNSSPAGTTTPVASTCANGGTNYPTCTAPVAQTCTNGGTNYPTCTAPVSISTAWEPVVTSVPAPTYAAGSNNLAAFTLLNQLRSAAGSGLLAQNAQLDTAAANHTNYLVLTNWIQNMPTDMHIETAGLPGFTGVSPSVRAAYAGYTGNATEVGGGGTGAQCVHALVEDTIYHRLAIIGGNVDVGISLVNTNDTLGDTYCVIDLGISTALGGFNEWGGQIPVNPVVYPYNGRTGVDTTFTPAGESPNPAPDLGSAKVGLPITVSLVTQSLVGANLAGFVASDVIITAFTLTAQGATTPVNARIVTYPGVVAGAGVTLVNDPASFLGVADSFLLPLAPLAPNTTYNVIFKATVKGQTVSLAWTFTTGAGN
jgi:hypothetical protein